MKRIAILGGGESGIGAALLAKAKGFEAFVSEAATITVERKALLDEHGIAYEEGGHSRERIFECQEVIKSPGIPEKVEIVQEIAKRGISIIDELEFASRYSKGKVIAITGTNGKTTTTLLTYHLLVQAGLDVGLAGNVGKSWAGQLTVRDHDWWVMEVSSFQIDGFKKLKPEIAIILNITPDHLDRYEYRMENYIHSKLSLIKNMDENGHLIYFKEDQYIWKGLKELLVKPQVHEVSTSLVVENGTYFDGTSIHVNGPEGIFSVEIKDIALQGDHNMINVMSAVQAALLSGCSSEAVRAGLKDFINAPHRMEKVAEIDEVLYINDSKGTNVNASYYALATYKVEPIVWIAGGVDKGNDYTELYPVIDRVKALICLSKDCEKLKEAFADRIEDISTTEDIKEAVAFAREKAQAGDVVLFSPACSSFDLFKNYIDRGEQFISAVRELEKVK